MQKVITELETIHQHRRKFEAMMETTLISFQYKMYELTQLIKKWLRDKEICVFTTEINLNINLPFTRAYPLLSIGFEYKGVFVRIIPKYILVAGGAKGVAYLTYDGLSQDGYSIFMEVPQREHEGWIISRSDKTSSDGFILTSEVFMSALAKTLQ